MKYRKATNAERWQMLIAAVTAQHDAATALQLQPGKCGKCGGSGTFKWKEKSPLGEIEQEGVCYGCGGEGYINRVRALRNVAYHKARFLDKIHVLEVVANHVYVPQLQNILRELVLVLPGFKDHVQQYIKEAEQSERQNGRKQQNRA